MKAPDVKKILKALVPVLVDVIVDLFDNDKKGKKK